MLNPIAIATAVSGTLDILFAMILTVFFGREIGNMLRYVGSGPVPGSDGHGNERRDPRPPRPLRADGDHGGCLHAARAQPARTSSKSPIQWGVIYGLMTYFVMNWLVVPLRFDAPLPPSRFRSRPSCSRHIVLVGIPMALIAARYLKPRTA